MHRFQQLYCDRQFHTFSHHFKFWLIDWWCVLSWRPFAYRVSSKCSKFNTYVRMLDTLDSRVRHVCDGGCERAVVAVDFGPHLFHPYLVAYHYHRLRRRHRRRHHRCPFYHCPLHSILQPNYLFLPLTYPRFLVASNWLAGVECLNYSHLDLIKYYGRCRLCSHWPAIVVVGLVPVTLCWD